MAQAALLARSSDYATPPWGEEDQPRFINACIEIETGLDPHALLFTLHKIEQKFGRDRAKEQRWGPRTLDLDLIAYDDVTLDKPELTLPHPRLFERAFVLVPLAEIAPDRVIAGSRVKRRAGKALDRRYRAAAGPRLKQRKQPFGLAVRAVAISGHTTRRVLGMTTTPDLPLAADFAPATQDDWRKLVDGVLKGAPFERLVGKTYDGLKIAPIYPRAKGADADCRPRGGDAMADHAAGRSSRSGEGQCDRPARA